ncbi:MAG: nucleotide-binding protein [Nitrospiraceae bacterium]
MAPRPTLFIASSSESRPVVTAVEKHLRQYAHVMSWCHRTFFGSGLYYLDSIIQRIPDFDFAVVILGPDDLVTSRGKSQSAPRDNVLFEFGYAMAKLGRERVFHLVPKGPNLDVKVLSDLAGMKPWEYWPKGRSAAALSAALKEPCTLIGQTVARIGPRRHFERGVMEGPQYVGDVYDDLFRALDRKTQVNTVRNIALDMEQTWPAIRDRFMLNDACPSTRWQSLIVDPNAASLKPLEGPSFSTDIAAAMLRNMRAVLDNEIIRKPPGTVQYECRAYSTPPGIHGFLVNDRVALISLCGLSSKWVGGTASPYLRFEKGSGIEAADHMVESFTTLFEFQWAGARRLWPAKRKRGR